MADSGSRASASMSCGLIWALNDSADGSGDGYDPVGVQAATVAAWNPLSEDLKEEVSPCERDDCLLAPEGLISQRETGTFLFSCYRVRQSEKRKQELSCFPVTAFGNN